MTDKNESVIKDETQKQKELVFHDLASASVQITTLTRYIGFGLTALAFTILSADKAPLSTLAADRKTMVVLVALLGVLTSSCLINGIFFQLHRRGVTSYL